MKNKIVKNEHIQLLLFEGVDSLITDCEIFPIYIPNEFKDFKTDYLEFNSNKSVLFSKLDSIGNKLRECFPEIIDFDLSIEAQNREKPWLYINSKDIDLTYLAGKTVEGLAQCLKEKDLENFEIFCESLIDAIYNLEIGDKLNTEEIKNKNRLIEGILAHKLASNPDIYLKMSKVIRHSTKDDFKKDKFTENDINTFDIKFFNKEEGTKEYFSAKKERWYELQELVKIINFNTCFENNKYVVISDPITHNSNTKYPVYSSYVISFSIEERPCSFKSYIKIHISRRIWVNSKPKFGFKGKRKHSLYTFNRNRTVSKFMLKKNNKTDDINFVSKSDRLYLEKTKNINKEILDDILENASKYQTITKQPFIGIPYDAQTFSIKPRGSGVGNMEKLALSTAIKDTLNLKLVDNIDFLKNSASYKNGFYNLRSSKDICIQIWECYENFFDTIVDTTLNLINKKDTFFTHLSLIDRNKDLVKFKFTVGEHERIIYFNKITTLEFNQKLTKSPKLAYLDINNTIDTYSPNNEDINASLIELIDFRQLKTVKDYEDPKNLLKLAFMEKGQFTQILQPFGADEEESVKTGRIKSALSDLLLQVGLYKDNVLNNNIITYEYTEHKITVPAKLTNLSSNENIKNITVYIPIISKANNKTEKFTLLETDANIWVEKHELLHKINVYIKKALTEAEAYIGAEKGISKFSKVFNFIKNDINSTDTDNRVILMWAFNSERDDFNTLYKNYILEKEEMILNSNIEVMFIKNNSTTPQFITTEKNIELYKKNTSGDLELLDKPLNFTATTNTAGYFKFSDFDTNNNKLICLIGDKPNTHTPNRANSGFESNKGEQRRRLLELVYLGNEDLDDISYWYQQNRFAHPSYPNMLNYHIQSHISLKLQEYIDTIEYKLTMHEINIHKKEDLKKHFEIESHNDTEIIEIEQMSFILDSLNEDNEPQYIHLT